MNQLEVLRESLGQCDEIVLDALLMRNRIVEDIMAYKEANDIPILQPEQEAKQREWLNRRMEGRRHKDEVTAVFEEITRNSKRIQARKLFDYNIVLIGFMGAGKSTISDFLRTVFAMEVVEMDQIIAEREGMSISDIFDKTSVCPLAKVMRRELKKRGIKKLKVVYSQEKPTRPIEDMSISCRSHCICPPGAAHKCTERRDIPGSTAFVPSVVGLIIAGEVIKDLAHN